MKNEQEKDNEAYEKYVRYRKAKADYERKCTGWVTIVIILIMIALYFYIFQLTDITIFTIIIVKVVI